MSSSDIVYLLHDKGLAFCYALLSKSRNAHEISDIFHFASI